MNYIYGWHAVFNLLSAAPSKVINVYLQKGRHDKRTQKLEDLLQKTGLKLEYKSKADLESLLGKVEHQGVAASCAKFPTYVLDDLESWVEKSSTPPLIVVLDGVQDPHNLGACLRSANAFGADAVVVPENNAAGLTSTVIKVSCGGAMHTPLVIVKNLARAISSLQQSGIWTVGMDMAAESDLAEVDLKVPVALVLGGEAQGLRRLTQRHCDFMAKVDMSGQVESLNVSVSCAISLYEATRQRRFS